MLKKIFLLGTSLLGSLLSMDNNQQLIPSTSSSNSFQNKKTKNFLKRSKSLNDLKIKKFEESKCAICLQKWGEEIKHELKLTCGHSFHLDCVHQEKNCPICRKKLNLPYVLPSLQCNDLQEYSYLMDLSLKDQEIKKLKKENNALKRDTTAQNWVIGVFTGIGIVMALMLEKSYLENC